MLKSISLCCYLVATSGVARRRGGEHDEGATMGQETRNYNSENNPTCKRVVDKMLLRSSTESAGRPSRARNNVECSTSYRLSYVDEEPELSAAVCMFSEAIRKMCLRSTQNIPLLPESTQEKSWMCSNRELKATGWKTKTQNRIQEEKRRESRKEDEHNFVLNSKFKIT